MDRFTKIMLAIGIVLLLLPLFWSLRADIYQDKLKSEPRVVTKSPDVIVEKKMGGARIRIARLNLDAVVVDETRPSDLDLGPMHLKDTAVPGMTNGNCCIAAHKEKWFRGLKRLQVGDKVIIEMINGKNYIYSVTGQQVARADRTELLDDTPSPTLTLITCTGPAYFGRGNGRRLVSAVLTKIE